jgi:hypothetical protein
MTGADLSFGHRGYRYEWSKVVADGGPANSRSGRHVVRRMSEAFV